MRNRHGLGSLLARPPADRSCLARRDVTFRVLIFVLMALLTSCAKSPTRVHDVAPRPPVAWAQTVDERGVLPIGWVVAIERVGGPAALPDTVDTQPQEIAKGVIGNLIVVPLALATAPLVLAGEGMRETATEDPGSDNRGHVFRHRVRLIGLDQEVFRDEFWSYAIGDCVAIRTQPAMLVLALDGECDRRRAERE